MDATNTTPASETNSTDNKSEPTLQDVMKAAENHSSRQLALIMAFCLLGTSPFGIYIVVSAQQNIGTIIVVLILIANLFYGVILLTRATIGDADQAADRLQELLTPGAYCTAATLALVGTVSALLITHHIVG